jgi:prepilin-type N-terminal cleavage/methylation domain-containing protein
LESRSEVRNHAPVHHAPGERGARRFDFQTGSHSASPRASAFTLIELVLVLSILALLTAAAVPSVRGLQAENAARAPLSELAKLAKATRLQAIKDKRPYQIAFTAKGFSATRYLSPYLQMAQLDEFMQQTEVEAQQKAEAGITEESEDAAAQQTAATTGSSIPVAAFKEWTDSYAVPEGMTYGIQFWHEAMPTPIEGEMVKLWVFQPTGIVAPLTVDLHHNGYVFTATFSALTADIVKETSSTE